MENDIVSPNLKQELADIDLFDSIIELLQNIKLVYGGEGLRSSLLRHKKLRLFLEKRLKCDIIDLEGKITDNLHCHLGD